MTRASLPPISRVVLSVLLICGVLASCRPLSAQSNSGCTPAGYRVIAHRRDAVLRMNWELRQDCAHPEWPARAVAASDVAEYPPLHTLLVANPEAPPLPQPLLVHAGNLVRLWQQDRTVRIEMSGIAEQSAHEGDRVVVRITRQTEDAGLSVQRFSGIVRASGDVEMER
jgi:hypothetical protein